MKTCYRNLFILLTLMVYIQSIMSYPSSNINAQRSFLRCHFSAIACKRSLKQTEQPTAVISKNDLQSCIKKNKSIWFCLNHSPPYTLEDMNQNY